MTHFQFRNVNGGGCAERRVALLPALALLAAVAALDVCPDLDQPPEATRGCCKSEGLGYKCRLSTGLVSVDVTYVEPKTTITCEDGTTKFQCNELQKYLKEELRKSHANNPTLTLVKCELHEPLGCAAALVNEDPSEFRLELKNVPTPLLPDHLRDMPAPVKDILIYRPGPDVGGVPYKALGGLKLKSLKIKNGIKIQLKKHWQPEMPTLERLDLSNDRVGSIPPRAFDGLPNLKNLIIWRGLTTFNELSLEGLAQLQSLSLCQNALTSLPPGLLNATRKLTELHLLKNQLRSLPANLLNHLKYLQEINISNVKNVELQLDERSFAGLRALQRLSLARCGLRALPPRLLAGARALRRLALPWNRLAALPAALLANATALQHLDLKHNELRSLDPDAFSNLTELITLDLSSNGLTELDPGLFKGLVNLQNLTLSHNKLSLEPARSADSADRALSPLSALRSLRRLRADRNAVRRIMPDWRNMTHLETLDLSHNAITVLTDNDLQFISEAKVDLNHNNISQIIPAKQTKPNSGFLKANFSLENNLLNCDCNMYNFMVAIKKSIEFARSVGAERAKCAAPADLAGRALLDLRPGDLRCVVPPPACPAACRCAVLADGLLDLRCDEVPRDLATLAHYDVAGVALRLNDSVRLNDLNALPPEIRLLDLSSHRLTVAPAARACDRLTVDLSYNALTEAPLALLEGNCTVRLAGNNISCDCAHRDSLARLQRLWDRVEDREDLRCQNGIPVRLAFVMPQCENQKAGLIGGCTAAACLVVGAIIALVIRFSVEIRLLLLKIPYLGLILEEKDSFEHERKYDAFVSFSHHDDDFVRDELVPRLESGPRPLRLCVHYRDWTVGEPIPEQAERSVRESRRTIVVVSAAFLRSERARVEFRAAHARRRAVLLLRGGAAAARADGELRAYLASHTYVRADDPRVWERVRAAVLGRAPRSRSDHVAPPLIRDV